MLYHLGVLLLTVASAKCLALPRIGDEPLSIERDSELFKKLRNSGLLDHYKDYMKYKREFNKLDLDHNDELKRLAIYIKNVKVINEHNERYKRNEVTYRKGINRFTDMTADELRMFKGFRNDMRKSKSKPAVTRENLEVLNVKNLDALPSWMDWRKSGYVTRVKDQGQCGSCWAFSATGSLEGQNKIKTGKLMELSEQNLVDCSGDHGNMGCDGGLMDQAFNYVKDNDGVNTEGTYPYEAVDDECRFNNRTVGATCSGYSDLASYDERLLAAAVAGIGPISVAIDAEEDFIQYSEGIFFSDYCSQDYLDHGVLAVGYGTTYVKQTNGKYEKMDYWLVKNSWNVDWGEKGYIRMARNRNNMCGIATSASYPVV